MHKPDVAEHFNRNARNWSAQYDREHDIVSYEFSRRKSLALNALGRLIQTPDAEIIDVGCGPGKVLASIIDAHPTWQGIGLDVSTEMLLICQENYHQIGNLRFIQHDVNDSALDLQGDAVLALGVLGYLSDLPQALEHIADMLKPEGLFIFTINKPSIPRFFSMSFRKMRVLARFIRYRHQPEKAKSLYMNQAFHLGAMRTWLAPHFDVLETYDYCFMPYVPGLRRLVGVSRALECIFGRRPTPLSSTTLFVTQKKK